MDDSQTTPKSKLSLDHKTARALFLKAMMDEENLKASQTSKTSRARVLYELWYIDAVNAELKKLDVFKRYKLNK